MSIIPISAFEDNYIWLIHSGSHAVVIDPGDAVPVLNYLNLHALQLCAILVTHHHHDHIGGISSLLEHHPSKVYAPSYRHFPFPHHPVKDHTTINIHEMHLSFEVMWVPGHTLDHVAYFGDFISRDPALFCGDTVFSAGCGRLFEGTATQMLTSLHRIKRLPTNTEIYCAHEYTAKNIAFAHYLEPNNLDIQQRLSEVTQLRSHGLPTLPSTLSLELKINPFLRCNQPELIQSLALEASNELNIFSTIREMRNNY